MSPKQTVPTPSRLTATAASLVLGSLIAAAAAAQDEPKMEPVDSTADAFVSLFNGTCVKYYGSPDKLEADLESRKVPVVDDAHRSPFLHEQPGQAWSLSSEKGDFVIALRKTGSCSVFARRAKDVDVQLLFASLVQRIQVPGAPMEKIADKHDPSAAGETHYVAYAQQRTTPGPYARFSLATTASDTVAIQAVATVTTAEKQ
jgi:hypothetical protein